MAFDESRTVCDYPPIDQPCFQRPNRESQTNQGFLDHGVAEVNPGDSTKALSAETIDRHETHTPEEIHDQGSLNRDEFLMPEEMAKSGKDEVSEELEVEPLIQNMPQQDIRRYTGQPPGFWKLSSVDMSIPNRNPVMGLRSSEANPDRNSYGDNPHGLPPRNDVYPPFAASGLQLIPDPGRTIQWNPWTAFTDRAPIARMGPDLGATRVRSQFPFLGFHNFQELSHQRIPSEPWKNLHHSGYSQLPGGDSPEKSLPGPDGHRDTGTVKPVYPVTFRATIKVLLSHHVVWNV